MQRKLVRQGRNALTVTLPAKWTQSKGLEAGDVVEIVENNQGLAITSNAAIIKKKTSITIDSQDTRFLQYILNNYYRAGYDEIKIKTTISHKDITSALRLLMGFDVTKQTKNIITIESVTEPRQDKVDILVRQIFFIVLEDLSYIISSLENNTKIDIDQISLNSDRAIKNANFCIRLCSKYPHLNSGFYWTLTNLVTWVSRQLYYLSKSLQTQKSTKLSKRHLTYLHSCRDMFINLHEGVYEKSLEKLGNVHTLYRKHETTIIPHLTKQNHYVSTIIHYFSMIAQYIMRSTSSAIGMVTVKD